MKITIAVLNYENGALSVFPIDFKGEDSIEEEISKRFKLESIEWMIVKSIEMNM